MSEGRRGIREPKHLNPFLDREVSGTGEPLTEGRWGIREPEHLNTCLVRGVPAPRETLLAEGDGKGT